MLVNSDYANTWIVSSSVGIAIKWLKKCVPCHWMDVNYVTHIMYIINSGLDTMMLYQLSSMLLCMVTSFYSACIRVTI